MQYYKNVLGHLIDLKIGASYFPQSPWTLSGNHVVFL